MRLAIVKILFAISLFINIFLANGCSKEINKETSKENKIVLWNGTDLKGWEVIPQDAVEQNTWFVEDGLLCSTGQPNGYIRTDKEYSNYHLHVEWRWPENAAQGRNRNSGVFVNMIGPDKVCPKLVECQLMSGEAGQLVLFNGAGITIDGKNMQNPDRQFVGIPKKQASSEKPAGQWNSYDIYCLTDTIKCVVNDVTQNEGTNVKPDSGYICFQSEGSAIEFRNIYIEPLEQK